MILIDMQSRTPIYEQIKEQVIYLIGCGVYKPGEQLPSIRSLAKELSLNVNTVKRAFSELEADGVTYSLAGRGIFVSEGALCNRRVIDSAISDIEQVIKSARAKGVSKQEIIELTESIYKEDNV